MNTPNPDHAYREASVRSADAVELVIMLYDIAIADMRRAIEAATNGDIERRTNEIRHAMLVLEQLQGTLNMEQGGQTAQSLDRLYSYIRGKLLEAQIKSAVPVLEEQLGYLLSVRDAWKQVQPQASAATEHSLAPAPVASTEGTALHWSA